MYHVRRRSAPKVARDPDGSATVDFRVGGLGEITRWILSYSDQVEVLSPAELRKIIAGIAHRMVEISNTDPRQQISAHWNLWNLGRWWA
jgi:predicted DNA-binding transcriptional regulator YafY